APTGAARTARRPRGPPPSPPPPAPPPATPPTPRAGPDPPPPHPTEPPGALEDAASQAVVSAHFLTRRSDRGMRVRSDYSWPVAAAMVRGGRRRSPDKESWDDAVSDLVR